MEIIKICSETLLFFYSYKITSLLTMLPLRNRMESSSVFPGLHLYLYFESGGKNKIK